MSDMVMAIKVMATAPLRKLMDKKNKELEGFTYSFLHYVNGREKGFCIVDNRGYENHDGLAVTFSECRGSDSLAIFVGRDPLWEYEEETLKKAKKLSPLNFLIDHDTVALTDEIYENHAYYVWCDAKKWYPKVGQAIADLLTFKMNENTFAKVLKKIDTDAKKEIKY